MSPSAPTRRIGVTMREVRSPDQHEVRDALAQDWGRFLAWALPDAAWLPIPNLAHGAIEFAARWDIDGLILTGGEDIGAAPARDLTERSLLGEFLRRKLPVLGVCRGLQLLWTEAGGQLCPLTGHIATRHVVRARGHLRDVVEDGAISEVNSYHSWGLQPGHDGAYTAMWEDADGRIEGVVAPRSKVAGIMWHPERELVFNEIDRRLVRWLFLEGDE